MTIQLSCASCQAVFQVKDELAGQRRRCPHCRSLMEVPAVVVTLPAPRKPPVAAEPLVSSSTELMQAILASFEQEFPAVPTTLAYQAGILLVAFTMLLLPVLYLGLIGMVAYLTFWHATENTFFLHRVGSIWSVLFLYLGPLIVGSILLVFMIKPLFAGRAKLEKSRPLHPSKEALLFAFVTRIARAVGAPEPRRIEIDWTVNASASLGQGLAWLFGRNLVLTIGLPLVGGLTVEELAAVVAHELGHFAQGAGMRINRLIWTINEWFERAVYHRDSWDEQLAEWCQEASRLVLIFWIAAFCVALTRGVLWMIMKLGQILSCFLLRQMEFDADRCATRLIGSKAYEETSRKIMIMSIASNATGHAFMESITTGAHLRDVPSLIVESADQLPKKVRRRIEKALKKERTSLFDTHPAFADRMASVRKEKAEGIFHLDRPALDLFSDYEKLAKSVTADLYRKVLRQIGD